MITGFPRALYSQLMVHFSLGWHRMSLNEKEREKGRKAGEHICPEQEQHLHGTVDVCIELENVVELIPLYSKFIVIVDKYCWGWNAPV